MTGVIELEKSPFGNHKSNNWFKQKTSVAVKTSGGKYDEKQDTEASLKSLVPRYLLITGGQRVTLQWQRALQPTDEREHHQEQADRGHVLLGWYTEKDTAWA